MCERADTRSSSSSDMNIPSAAITCLPAHTAPTPLLLDTAPAAFASLLAHTPPLLAHTAPTLPADNQGSGDRRGIGWCL